MYNLHETKRLDLEPHLEQLLFIQLRLELSSALRQNAVPLAIKEVVAQMHVVLNRVTLPAFQVICQFQSTCVARSTPGAHRS